MVDLHCMAHKYNQLPEGLNELMADFSREVLRAQPEDIHGFIARYLGALLEARKALTIAGSVCEDIRSSCCRIEEEKAVTAKKDFYTDERKGTFKEEKEAFLMENDAVGQIKIFEEQKEENESQENQNACVDESAVNQEMNVSRNTIDVGEPTQDEALQSGLDSSYVETEEYYKYRQHRDFWSHSVFSLPGSYMNLPTWRPYSAYDSITTTSKPSTSKPHQRQRCHHDFIVDSMCDRDSMR